MSGTAKTLTVRLPMDLYDAARDLSARRRRSLNAVVQDGLEALIKQEEYQRLYEAFGELGEDAAECDVEFAVDAQTEVVQRGES